MKKEELVKGAWYRGAGLNRLIGCMGLWDGDVFAGFQQKFGMILETGMCHDEGMKIKLVEPEE